MMLGLMILWASLYVNELLAAAFVIGTATFLGFLGSFPTSWQPFVITPMAALLHPAHSVVSGVNAAERFRFGQIFLLTAGAMTSASAIALCSSLWDRSTALCATTAHSENVVCKGDSVRKRRFRFRLHIQRPSEISFFYENRTMHFRRWEAIARWGISMTSLLLVSGGSMCLLITLIGYLAAIGESMNYDAAIAIHITCQVIHGCGLALAILLLSHSRNTTYLQLPWPAGHPAKVSLLDTFAFGVFLLVSSAFAILTPH